MKYKSEKQRDFVEGKKKIITDSIIAQLETVNADDWKKSWFSRGGIPLNAITKQPYKGVNWLYLSTLAYKYSHFAGYKQWANAGYDIAKGAKSHPVMLAQIVENKKKKLPSGNYDKFWSVKWFNVFNCEQLDEESFERYTNKLAKENTKKVILERDPLVESFIDNCNINTSFVDGDRCCYIPSLDKVEMQPIETFESIIAYYSVLMHEYTHATKSKERVNRVANDKHSPRERYAFEELVAELGAVYTMQTLGFYNVEPREDHVQYIKSWLQALKNNTDYIFQASSKANTAVNWMMNQQPKDIQTTLKAVQS